MTDNPDDTPNTIFDDPLQEWRLSYLDESAARSALWLPGCSCMESDQIQIKILMPPASG